jgi:hypothetical protein
MECGSFDRHAGNWTASLRILRTEWVLEWETRPEYGIAGENLCTPFQRPRTYSLSQGLLNHASIRQIRELFAYALENIIAHLLETEL